MTLTCRRVSPNVRSIRSVWGMRASARREPEVGGDGLAVGEHALDRRGELPLVAAGEASILDWALRKVRSPGTTSSSRSRIWQNTAFTSSPRSAGTLAATLPARWMRQRCRSVEAASGPPRRGGQGAVGDDQQRRRQAPSSQVVEEAVAEPTGLMWLEHGITSVYL